MTAHWWHVVLAWGAAALAFGGLALDARVRTRHAGRRLAALDPRAAPGLRPATPSGGDDA